jgi:hypothetical protein
LTLNRIHRDIAKRELSKYPNPVPPGQQTQANARRAKRVGVVSDPKRNSMNEQTRAVDLVLEEWGKWMRNANKVLGWQTCNILGKVRVEGLAGAAQANAPTDIPQTVMETDAAVAKLDKIYQDVLAVEYISHSNASSDTKRRKLKMDKSRWDNLLGQARKFVAMTLGVAIAA